MFIRPALSSSLGQAARSSLRSQAPAARSYATEAGKPSGGSNLPLILGLGGIAGLGAWYSLGGFDDPKAAKSKIQEKGKEAADKAKGAVDQAKGAVDSAKGAVGSGALNKDKFLEFTLKEIKPYNHDSATLVFELPDGQKPGMSTASAVVVKAVGDAVKDDQGKDVIRPYTPITSPDTAGHMDFLIKKYPGGKMTTHMHSMKPGDKLGIKGPIAKFPYKANEFESIGMIAGGSGITPMWQVMQDIANDPSDKTKVTLIYTNKTEQDILLREEFDKLAKDGRFNIVYGLDKLPKGFKGFEGYLTEDLATKHLPKAELANKTKIFVCGPPPQVEAISGGKGPKGSQGELKGLLAKLGYQAEQVYKF
ncbi:Oxidoreductase, FAD-binding domain protein [Kalmanozyma brasiliensis GHG001]|uniref:NADH-cytochrome b5 reductase n=1 Tax=Kalmanozyma brasiliensis (strain GHG001) TaxID=1365824 RepID=V5EYV9_KALBG|nr:Oxidoreductase, FAD-binding domain protein [Kalmanozyma brasiliensis GHG001]EST08009.1 Oxidoreductase, FAD-binding domain protein [Kalmanozyma brasiliensis GHG001]